MALKQRHQGNENATSSMTLMKLWQPHRNLSKWRHDKVWNSDGWHLYPSSYRASQMPVCGSGKGGNVEASNWSTHNILSHSHSYFKNPFLKLKQIYISWPFTDWWKNSLYFKTLLLQLPSTTLLRIHRACNLSLLRKIVDWCSFFHLESWDTSESETRALIPQIQNLEMEIFVFC